MIIYYCRIFMFQSQYVIPYHLNPCHPFRVHCISFFHPGSSSLFSTLHLDLCKSPMSVFWHSVQKHYWNPIENLESHIIYFPTPSIPPISVHLCPTFKWLTLISPQALYKSLTNIIYFFHRIMHIFISLWSLFSNWFHLFSLSL